MPDTLHIRLLGDFSLVYRGSQLDAFNKPRLQSLLAYLALHSGAAQFRYHLANLLWPDSAEAQAYTNLRNLVYHLRQALPDSETFLRADGQTLQWNKDAPYSLDVLDFTRALEPVEAVEPPAAKELPFESLEKAVQSYHGDLLPSCYDSWIIPERERLRLQFLSALDQLAARLEAQRRYPEAITHTQRLAEADPLHPAGYPRLMRLFALSGDPPAALKAYRSYARTLTRELGVAPDEEVQNLYFQLKGNSGWKPVGRMPVGLQPGGRMPVGWKPGGMKPGGTKQESGPAGAAAAAYPKEIPGDPGDLLPLVGRHPEWQAIQALWKAASAGAPRMLWLSGEAGIGKTRLAEELVLWARRQGIRTAVARSYPSEGSLPYAPVVSWLRSQRLPPLDKTWLVELSRLLPEASKEKPPPLTEAWQRLRLFEALAQALLAGRQRMILLIEDLQWCDHDTLEWLHYLLRFDARARLLVVGTVRSEEEAGNPALARLQAALAQEGISLELELGRLDEAETGQLAALVSGKTLDPGVGELIYQETEGSPLFIVETMRAEMNKQARLPGVQPLPYKARAVLQNRINQLSPGARELVGLAATIGREFPLQVLRQACSAGEVELIQGLDEMLRRRLVREIATETFDFSHAKLREAALVGVSSAHRQLLHRQVADALNRLAGNNLDSKSGEIASHYEAAGRAETAIQYYQAAAESARNIFANDLAIQYYRRALALSESPAQDGSPAMISPGQLCELHEKLGDMLALVGKYPEAQTSYERSLALPREANPYRSALLYRKIAQAILQEHKRPEALAALDRAERVLGLSDRGKTIAERQEWIQIQLVRSEILYWENKPDQMDAILQETLPIIMAEGRPDQHVDLLSQQLMSRCRHERYRLSAETVEIARRRLELVNSLNVPYNIAWAQFHMGFTLLWHGEPEAAREWLIQVFDAAERMGAGLLQLRALAYLSIASRQLGETQLLREQNPRLFELAGQIDEPAYQGISLANQGWLAWRDGDLARAETLCSSANEIWNQTGGHMFHWLADWILLAIAVTRRDLAQAEKRALALLDPSPLSQPVTQAAAAALEEALRACQAQEPGAALERFSQALELVKSTREL